MRAALASAAQARERETSPNPRVGAVVVKDGRVVATGFHTRAGRAHAEAQALEVAGEAAHGATLYVTLEPCTHHGRTPPCCDAIARAGIARVVVAMRDPNPQVSGSGAEWLAHRGIEVTVGCLEDEARRLNPFFLTWATRGRPYVTLKHAMTLDGRMACASRASQWITGPAARTAVHLERARHDAILVGIGTVLADDPRLTARVEGEAEWHPLRVVLDTHARTPEHAQLLHCGGGAPLIVVADGAPLPRVALLEATGANVVQVVRGDDGRLDLAAVLRALHQRGVTSVFVEGGAQVHASFQDGGLFDRLLAFVAPRVAGGGAAPSPALHRQGAPPSGPRPSRAWVAWDGDRAASLTTGGEPPRG